MLTKTAITKTIADLTAVANDTNRPEAARKMALKTIERMQEQYKWAPEELTDTEKHNIQYADASAQLS